MCMQYNGHLNNVGNLPASEIVKYITVHTQNISLFQTPIVQGVMVSHCEEDLLCIRAAYLKLTGTSLYTALQVGHAHTVILC